MSNLLAWQRINDGLMRYGIVGKQDGWYVVKAVTKLSLPTESVTTYVAYFLMADGLHHIDSGDTFKEAQFIVEQAVRQAEVND
jgi:hypothetical protein